MCNVYNYKNFMKRYEQKKCKYILNYNSRDKSTH